MTVRTFSYSRMIFLVMMTLASLAVFAQKGQIQSLDLVLTSARAPELDVTDNTVVRTTYGEINFDLFDTSMDRLQDGDVILLNLFPDVYHTAVLQYVEQNNSGTITWQGYLDDEDMSAVTMVIDQKARIVAGSIVMPGKMYKIRWAGNGVHAFQELNPDNFPADAEPIEFGGDDREEYVPEPVADDSGSVIDVLVVYTPAARSAQGGTSAINSLIDLAIAETNTSYANSQVNFRLNLVHKAEVSYTESGDFSTDLGRLTNTSDGYIDNVHSLRDQYCADMVSMVIEGSQYCGIANLMTSVSSSFASKAFSVTARTCATGYYSFGHELGHNMGARHDWYVDSSTSPYIYNHGYVKKSSNWRTIMAYNNECTAGGGSCTRLQYWSNPNVTYGGSPMGVGGSTSGSSAYNALALNNSASTVANFRNSATCSGGGCSGTEYTGSLSGTGAQQFQPNGTYYYSSTSGAHTATLNGPGGTDFDLYLWKWNGSAWATVATSAGSSSVESISYNGTSGYYKWRVYSYNGSGSYTLCTTRP